MTGRAVRLAVLSGQLGLGGAEQQLYHLLCNLDRSRFHATLINLGDRGEYWENPIKNLGISIWQVSRTAGRARRVADVARLLRSERIDIVHSWVLHANPYAAVGGRLGGAAVRLGSVRGRPSQAVLGWIGYAGLDVVVTNSDVIASRARAVPSPGTRIRVVPNGVLIPEPARDAERLLLKAALGAAGAHVVVGTIGRIDANKNHEMLLRAFAAIASKYSGAKLVIVGDGPLRSHLALLAERLGITHQISLPGAIPDGAQHLAALDVFCLTSHTEGMPNVLMEAAAAGLPVVSTTWSGCAALIDDGLTGMLVPSNDVETLSATLELLLSRPDLRAQLGKAARNKMRTGFSVSTMVSRLTHVYEEAFALKDL